MAQLRQHYAQFTSRDTQIIVIGPEGKNAFKKYWELNNLPFIGLPNPGSSVLKLYGQEINLFKLGRMPAQVIVDKQGCARFVHYGNSMSDIPSNEELLAQIDQINWEKINIK
jgi:peroxiredoxin Q/BCP